MESWAGGAEEALEEHPGGVGAEGRGHFQDELHVAALRRRGIGHGDQPGVIIPFGGRYKVSPTSKIYPLPSLSPYFSILR